MLRAILGAKNGTDSVALLVRGGWLSLHYELALHGFTTLYKINSASTGKEMFDQLNEFHSSDDIWNETIFYKPCYVNLYCVKQNYVRTPRAWHAKDFKIKE